MATIHEYAALQDLINRDPDYAWALFCNIAVPIMDAAGVSHKVANETAAHLMQRLWDCDITKHEHYAYGKSVAQSYAEFRIAMDGAEDAEIPAAAPPQALTDTIHRIASKEARHG